MKKKLVLLLIVTFSTLFYQPAYAIVGGTVAKQEERAYFARIHVGSYLCGGSLISDQWVLTAAHCLVDENGERRPDDSIRVFLGDPNRSRLDGTEQVRMVLISFVHPDYNNETIANDIALLYLNKPAKITDAVGIIPLFDGDVEVGATATISGFGDIDENETAPKSLMTGDITIANDNDCIGTYWDYSPESNLCGEEGVVDACYGDSGGPLVIDDKLAGVISYGLGCGKNPAVYVDVSYYNEWIKGTIVDHLSSDMVVYVPLIVR